MLRFCMHVSFMKAACYVFGLILTNSISCSSLTVVDCVECE
jgi:hypothetical protein